MFIYDIWYYIEYSVAKGYQAKIYSYELVTKLLDTKKFITEEDTKLQKRVNNS